MTVMAPSDENECRQMLYTGVQARHAGRGALPARRRARRGDRRQDARAAGRQGEMSRDAQGERVAHPRVRRDAASRALEAAEALDATVANMRFVKPLDAGAACASWRRATS